MDSLLTMRKNGRGFGTFDSEYHDQNTKKGEFRGPVNRGAIKAGNNFFGPTENKLAFSLKLPEKTRTNEVSLKAIRSRLSNVIQKDVFSMSNTWAERGSRRSNTSNNTRGGSRSRSTLLEKDLVNSNRKSINLQRSNSKNKPSSYFSRDNLNLELYQQKQNFKQTKIFQNLKKPKDTNSTRRPQTKDQERQLFKSLKDNLTNTLCKPKMFSDGQMTSVYKTVDINKYP